MDWLDFTIRVGFPLAALAAIGWFVTKHVWPFIVSAWQEQQKERREEREKYLASLKEQGESFRSILAEGERIRREERDKFLAALEAHRQATQPPKKGGRTRQNNDE